MIAAEVDSPSSVSDGLLRVRDLLNAEEIEQARALVRMLIDRWPDSEEVRYFSRVLGRARGSVRHGYRVRSLEPERDWLRRHGSNYPGCWIAVKGDKLVAADPRLDRVLRVLSQDGQNADALLHHQGQAQSPC